MIFMPQRISYGDDVGPGRIAMPCPQVFWKCARRFGNNLYRPLGDPPQRVAFPVNV
jgi:hypothetical protein